MNTNSIRDSYLRKALSNLGVKTDVIIPLRTVEQLEKKLEEVLLAKPDLAEKIRARVEKYTELLRTSPPAGKRIGIGYYNKTLVVPEIGDIIFIQNFNGMYYLLVTEVDMNQGKESYIKGVELEQVNFTPGSLGPAFVKARSDFYIFDYPTLRKFHPKDRSRYLAYDIENLAPYAETKETLPTVQSKEDRGLAKYIGQLSTSWQQELLQIPYNADKEYYSLDQLAFFCLNLTNESFDLLRRSLEGKGHPYANRLFDNDSFWRFRLLHHYGHHIPGLGDINLNPLVGYASWRQLAKRLNRCAYAFSPMRNWKKIENISSRSRQKALDRIDRITDIVDDPLEISLDPGSEITLAGRLKGLDLMVSFRHHELHLPYTSGKVSYEELRTQFGLKHLFLIDSRKLTLDDEIDSEHAFNISEPVDLVKVERIKSKKTKE